jgi:hypothetical protein
MRRIIVLHCFDTTDRSNSHAMQLSIMHSEGWENFRMDSESNPSPFPDDIATLRLRWAPPDFDPSHSDRAMQGSAENRLPLPHVMRHNRSSPRFRIKTRRQAAKMFSVLKDCSEMSLFRDS